MMLRLDHSSAVPLHAQVEVVLRRLILDPEYQDGKTLPAEEEMAARFGISRNTIRAGINRLVYEGLLVRKRGYGTVVAKPVVRSSRMEEWGSFTREMELLGHQVSIFYLSAKRVSAPNKVANILALREGTSVLKLERVKGFQGERVVSFVSYLHPRTKLHEEDDFHRPLYELIEERSGVIPEHSHESITAVAADCTQGAALDVELGAPLLRRERRVTDSGDRPVEYAVNHYRSDRFVYHLNIKRVVS